MSDPFAHHPGLKPLIQDPMTSRFRDFDIWELAKEIPDLDAEKFLIPTDDREAFRLAFLEDKRADDLWVFAYGSLCWDPGFIFEDVRRGFAPDYERKFILRDIFGGRGNAERPGLMAALDQGTGCDGLVYRIPQAILEAETKILWGRERAGAAYHETMIKVEIDGAAIKALAFVADHDSEAICAELTQDQQVTYLATGTGFLGSSLEYADSLAQNLGVLGIVDPSLDMILERARGWVSREEG